MLLLNEKINLLLWADFALKQSNFAELIFFSL